VDVAGRLSSPSPTLLWEPQNLVTTVQVVLILCQGYIPEKVVQIKIAQIKHKIPIQNSVFPGG
jgi:hypothetical protein